MVLVNLTKKARRGYPTWLVNKIVADAGRRRALAEKLVGRTAVGDAQDTDIQVEPLGSDRLRVRFVDRWKVKRVIPVSIRTVVFFLRAYAVDARIVAYAKARRAAVEQDAVIDAGG